MTSDIQLFTSPTGSQLRTTEIDGKPYFVGKDIAVALGHTNPQRAIRDHVDSEDRGVTEIVTPSGTQQMTVINESGLYSLILSSKLPTAKQFKRWVTSEVLPAIRKQGGYMVEKIDETPEETMARALNIAAATMERQKLRIAQLETTAATQQAALEEARPKALFADAVADSSSTCLIGELAKLLRQNGVEMGQNRLFAWLRSNGYLMKNNMPTQRAAEMKLFRVVERSVVQPDGYVQVTYTTKVTGKGQQYFINHFLSHAA